LLIQKAACEPVYRIEFYQRLLAEDLFVISDGVTPLGNIQIPVGTNINLARFPDGEIPVFTSKERIFDKGIITNQVKTLKMSERNLFELAKGAGFVLNPYSDFFMAVFLARRFF
jgi:hypothetical protein